MAGPSLIMVINGEGKRASSFLPTRRGEMKERRPGKKQRRDVTGKHKEINEKRG